MDMNKMRKSAAMLAVLLMVASSASAMTLWDQSDYDVVNPGFFNSDSGSPPFGLTYYTVGDVTVDNVWMVTSISQFYSGLDPFWADGIFQGYVCVFPKTGTLPVDGVDDPANCDLVPMTGVFNGDHILVTAPNLNISLNPGEYWIGITPIAASGPFGPEYQLPTTSVVGDASASWDAFGFPAPMWMNFVPGADGSLLIEGEIAVPNDSQSWGAVKSIYGE
jgi:hypothetical protein